MSNGVRIGFNQRLKPRLVILKGYDPQSSKLKQALRPVATGVTIMSGMLVVAKKNSAGVYEHVLPGTAGAVGVPAFALDDGADFNVAQSRLAALPVDGDYVVQTPYYTAGTYTVGVEVAMDTANPGNIKVAAAGDTVIGKVDGDVDSPIDIYGENNTAVKAGSTVVQVSTNPPYVKA